MAGKITVSTINDSSGVLATQNGMTGIAKAWVNFQGGQGNTAGTINGSFNVSSITVTGTGQFTANFTTAMANANYSANVIQGWANYNQGAQSQINTSASTSSGVAVGLLNYTASSQVNPVAVHIQVFGA